MERGLLFNAIYHPHQWCLPSAPCVLSLSTICANVKHHMCQRKARFVFHVKQNALKALYIKELRKMNKEDNLKRTAYLKNIVLNMPEKPGTYQSMIMRKQSSMLARRRTLNDVCLLISIKRLTVLKQRCWFLRFMTFHILWSKQKKMHFL